MAGGRRAHVTLRAPLEEDPPNEDQEPERLLVRPDVHWLGPLLRVLGDGVLPDGYRRADGAGIFPDRARLPARRARRLSAAPIAHPGARGRPGGAHAVQHRRSLNRGGDLRGAPFALGTNRLLPR